MVERSLEIIAILITIVIGFLSHKRDIISIEFLINFISFTISWLIISSFVKINFKNLFLISIYSVCFGALLRAILLSNNSIPISFILVFYSFQTIMLYIAHFILKFIK
ncbi:MAG: DUF3054 family protein [candidate division WOR-3 bacterium]